MSDVHLIPYVTDEVVETVSEVPEGVRMIEAPELWGRADQGRGNVIAILDTGCQIDHPDLQGALSVGRISPQTMVARNPITKTTMDMARM